MSKRDVIKRFISNQSPFSRHSEPLGDSKPLGDPKPLGHPKPLGDSKPLGGSKHFNKTVCVKDEVKKNTEHDTEQNLHQMLQEKIQEKIKLKLNKIPLLKSNTTEDSKSRSSLQNTKDDIQRDLVSKFAKRGMKKVIKKIKDNL